jgi:hypothetical protein
MNRFIINSRHVRKQFLLRYKNYVNRADEIINKFVSVIEGNTPDDWRFTESASSRFIIIY